MFTSAAISQPHCPGNHRNSEIQYWVNNTINTVQTLSKFSTKYLRIFYIPHPTSHEMF